MRGLCCLLLAWCGATKTSAEVNAPLEVSMNEEGRLAVAVNGHTCLQDFGLQALSPGDSRPLPVFEVARKRRTIGNARGYSLTRWAVRGKLGTERSFIEFGETITVAPCCTEASWEVTSPSELPIGGLGLSGEFPLAFAVGSPPALWYLFEGPKVTSRPARLEPKGQAVTSSTEATALGWITERGQGLLLTRRRGTFSRVTIEDARPIGGKGYVAVFQWCEPGTLRPGQTLRARMTIAPFNRAMGRERLAAANFARGESLLKTEAAILGAGGPHPRAEVRVRNLAPVARKLNVSVSVLDWIGRPLACRKTDLSVGANDEAQFALGFPAGNGPLRFHYVVTDPAHHVRLEDTQRIYRDRFFGCRQTMSLDGMWEHCVAPDGLDRPPAGPWEAVQVPGNVPVAAVHDHWFRRTFRVPGTMRGKQLFVHFTAVYYAARVWVNGKEVGSHFGGLAPFEVPVTEAVKWDGDNELLVGVTDWSAATTVRPLPPMLEQDRYETYYVTFSRYIEKYLRGSFVGVTAWVNWCGILMETSLEARPAVHVSDVFVKTFLGRGGRGSSPGKREMVCQLTLRNDSAAPAQVTLGNEVLEAVPAAVRPRPSPSRKFVRIGPRLVPLPTPPPLGLDRAVLRLPATALKLQPREERVVTVRQAWPKPQLWWPHDPHLYELRTTLWGSTRETRSAGNTGGGPPETRAVSPSLPVRPPLDVVATRFGFREVGTDGKYILLNGTRLFLPGWSCGLPEARWDYADSLYRRALAANLRLMRLWHPATPKWVDIADEMGVLLEIGGLGSQEQMIDRKDERFWRHFEKESQDLVRRDRNHPSFIMYSVENEMGYGSGSWMEPHLGKIADEIRKVDDTKLITFESDLDPNGRSDMYNVHYPMEVLRHNCTLYPDASYWLDGPPGEAFYRSKGWVWKRDKPLFSGEWNLGLWGWRDYRSLWIGERAYSDQDAWGTGDAEFDAFEIQAYRYYGVAGSCSWAELSNPRIAAVWKREYAPLKINFREYDWHFSSGETVPRTLHIHNDTLARSTFALRWTLRQVDRVLQHSEGRFALDPAEVRVQRVTLRMPRVAQRTRLMLIADLLEERKVVASERREYHVFPERTAPPKLSGPVGLIDATGVTGRVLAWMGVPTTPLKLEQISGFNGHVVVIGDGSLGASVAALASSLFGFVTKGGAVVCLQQEDYPRWLPTLVNVDPDSSSTITFNCAPGHPILAGVSRDDLKFWRPGHIVSRRNLVKPRSGSFRAILENGGRDGLKWTPLLELPYGTGVYLLSQLDLVSKAKTEPMARQLLANILGHADGFERKQPRLAGVQATPGGAVWRMLEGSGIACANLAGEQADLSRFGAVVVEGSGATWQEAAKRLSDLRAYAERGGVVWIHCLEPGSLSGARGLVGIDFGLKETGADLTVLPERVHADSRVTVGVSGATVAIPEDKSPVPGDWPLEERGEPLLAGLSNYDLFWHEPYVWDGPFRYLPTARFVLTGFEGTAARALLLPPLLVKVPVGRGLVLLDQVLWGEHPSFVSQSKRYVCTLASNLGLAFAGRLTESLRPESFFLVDLRRHANMALADEVEGDRKGGWTDQGPQDLHELPSGRLVGARAVFEIADPAANNGRAIITLRGAQRPYFPEAARGIEVGRKAKALHFLHGSAWSGPDGNRNATYVVHYADASTVEIPVVVGVSIADWFQPPVDLPGAECAWRGRSIAGTPCAIYEMTWRNPRPDEVVESVDFVSSGSGVPVLLAISGEES